MLHVSIIERLMYILCFAKYYYRVHLCILNLLMIAFTLESESDSNMSIQIIMLVNLLLNTCRPTWIERYRTCMTIIIIELNYWLLFHIKSTKTMTFLAELNYT